MSDFYSDRPLAAIVADVKAELQHHIDAGETPYYRRERRPGGRYEGRPIGLRRSQAIVIAGTAIDGYRDHTDTAEHVTIGDIAKGVGLTRPGDADVLADVVAGIHKGYPSSTVVDRARSCDGPADYLTEGELAAA